MEADEARRTASRMEAEINRIIIGLPHAWIGSRKLCLAKMEPPNFSGEMKDHPRVREDWKNIIGELVGVNQRFQIKQKEPVQEQRNIGNMSSMKDVSEY